MFFIFIVFVALVLAFSVGFSGGDYVWFILVILLIVVLVMERLVFYFEF